MKTIFANEVKIGQDISDEIFGVKSIKRGATKDGKPYFDIELVDKSGSLKGKIWSENVEACQNTKEGEVVRVFGKVNNFNNQPQIIVTALATAVDYNLDDLLPASEHDVRKMLDELTNYIKNIKNSDLKGLLNNIFTDEFLKKFGDAPAAYTIHHAYRSGLIEHTLDILEMAKPISHRYPSINFDLLVTGAILHDIGKLLEYSMGTTIALTTRGKLLGHVYLGAEFVRLNAPKDMPEDLLDEVIHMILSHQGHLEFGSPVLPKTTEAITLSALDDASFKINATYHTIKADEGDEFFTSYQRHLGTDLYKSPYSSE